MKMIWETIQSAVITALALLLHGYVLKVLWWWFAVPVFELPGLSYGHAMGLVILISFMVNQYIPISGKQRTLRRLYNFFMPIGMLSFGWLVKICFM